MADYYDPILVAGTDPAIHNTLISTKLGTARSTNYAQYSVDQRIFFQEVPLEQDLLLGTMFSSATNTFTHVYNPRTEIHSLTAIYVKVETQNNSGAAIDLLPAHFMFSDIRFYPNGNSTNYHKYPLQSYVDQLMTNTDDENYREGQIALYTADQSAAASTSAMYTCTTSVANGATQDIWYKLDDPLSRGKCFLPLLNSRAPPKLEFDVSNQYKDNPAGGNLTATAVTLYYYGVNYSDLVLHNLMVSYTSTPLVLPTYVWKQQKETINLTAGTEISSFNCRNITGKSIALVLWVLPQTLTNNRDQYTNNATGLLDFSNTTITQDNLEIWGMPITNTFLRNVIYREVSFPSLFPGTRYLHIIPFSRNMTESLRLNWERGFLPINNNVQFKFTPATTRNNNYLYVNSINKAVVVIAGGNCSMIE